MVNSAIGKTQQKRTNSTKDDPVNYTKIFSVGRQTRREVAI